MAVPNPRIYNNPGGSGNSSRSILAQNSNPLPPDLNANLIKKLIDHQNRTKSQN